MAYELLHSQEQEHSDRMRPLLDDKTRAGRDARIELRKEAPETPQLWFSPVRFRSLLLELQWPLATAIGPTDYIRAAVIQRADGAV